VSSQEKMFKIAVIAKALQVSNQTVFRMVQSGELSGVKENNAWRIPQSSLRQHILTRLGMSGPRGICDRVEENVSKMERKSQHLSELARYYMQKDMAESPTGDFTSHEAIVLLEPFMRKHARRLSGRNPWLRDDIYQSMALAMCLCAGKNVLMFYAFRATARAQDVLRKERRRGRVFHNNQECDVVVERFQKPDCSVVIELFKLAGMSLSLLEEFGIQLVDEGETNHVSVRSEGNDHCDECHDGRDEDVHQTPSADPSETRAA